MNEATGESARPEKRCARWPLLAALAWMAAGCAALAGLAAAGWPDDLRELGRLRTTASYAAFMCATFAFHAGVAMIGVAFLAMVMRRRRLLVVAAGAGLLCAGPELWWSVWRDRPEAKAADATRPVFTVMSMNVLYGRADPAQVRALVEEHEPDIIVFQEWTARAEQHIRPALEVSYPHWAVSDREDAFGQAVCSRRPFIRAARMFLPGGGHEPQITVEIEHDGRPLRVTNVHTLPPVSLAYFAEQRRVTRELAGWRAGTDAGDDPADAPHVLAGDFNAVSRSSTLAHLRRAGWREAHRGAGAIGRGSTWPRLGWLRWAPGIKLDHVLHTDELVCESSAVGRDMGSDHAPVVARFRWVR